MSMLSRFAGAMRHSLVYQSASRPQLLARAFSTKLSSPSYSTTSFTSSSSPSSYSSSSQSCHSSRMSTLTPAVSSEDSKSAEVVPASTPGTLPVGYIDDYHNHSHRHMPGDPSKRAFTYLILGSTKFIAASAARVAILKLIYTMSASADVLALGSVEVDLAAIPLGESATIKWRGKPVFIRHRTEDEIKLAEKDDNEELRHAEADAERVEKPEWLVVLGVCTHLGCVPIANAGDYHGWFCPCHGSHYDVSGRIRKGPAPLNLEVPTYRFIEDGAKMILG